MKLLKETIDRENFLEVVLSDYDMKALNDMSVLTNEVTLEKQTHLLSVRKQTQREKYPSKEDAKKT